MADPNPRILHLQTYFLFPFVIDRARVFASYGKPWSRTGRWIEGLDEWIMGRCCTAWGAPVRDLLGGWRRAAYDRFDLESPAYRDMVFFHPFVRRVFFDTRNQQDAEGGGEALIRCYEIPLHAASGVTWRAEDIRGRNSTVEIRDLRLFLFANGAGILSIGVDKRDLPFSEALWINEMMRKIYPSSGRQRREGRVPSLSRIAMGEQTVVEESFEHGDMLGYQPPLSRILTSLLYFLDYEAPEYEPVLDERMIVYTYAAADSATLPPDFKGSDAEQVLLSRFLYVDRHGGGFRYQPDFVRDQMRQDLYTRWSHEGTWYGFTSYSNITWTVDLCDRGEHLLKEGALIHRMFGTRYYLMAVVALFYRATLLDFAEQVALVSRRLYQDQDDGALSRDNVEIASSLRSEFLHFSNYWYFDELANKDEEIEHFARQCAAYRLDRLRDEIDKEIEKLNASLYEYSQNRSTEAVNRLAMISMILGAGAVLTGFFGMNFGREFQRLLFDPQPGGDALHWAAIALVSLLAFGSLLLGTWLIAANWRDYRDILRRRTGITGRTNRWYSLRQ